ncbi:MAG: hypothetical protein H6R17_3617 [Proteobacteria bacterium]|nr:hypothetical protein [Pseudomonadota bacterium]
MLKRMLILVALTSVSAFAVADDNDARSAAQQVVELQDGSTVYVFQDGKMAVENKYGRAVSTKPGTTLQAKDGSTIVIKGNEVARLDRLLMNGKES